MEKKIYDPTQSFKDELSKKETKIGGFNEDFSTRPKIKEFLNDFIKDFKQDPEETKNFNYWLYGAFYQKVLSKNEIDENEKSFLYHYYVLKTLKEKLANREDYNQVVIDLEYSEPFRHNLEYYKEKIKEIFNDFVYTDKFDYMDYQKKIDVKFVNTEYYDDEDE